MSRPLGDNANHIYTPKTMLVPRQMLDDTKRSASLDTKGMLGCVERMHEHLSEGFRLGRKACPAKAAVDGVIVCGVGGSAISGDLLRSWLSTECDVRCDVVRGYSLPGHVGPKSLVIVSSYSGNTEETISMLEDAAAKSSNIVTVSSGGRVAEAAAEKALPHVEVPGGMVPRASFGYMFGALLGVMDGSGVAHPHDQLSESRAVLSELNRACSAGVLTKDNPAKQLAHGLHGFVPVVIGHGLSAPVAKRWANQMNENAKSIAFSSELPEMDHNEIVSWASDPRAQGFSGVFLEHDHADERMARRLEATMDLMRERSRVHVVRASGEGPLAQALSLVAMGDYVSVYSALLSGEDPSTTEPIERLKRIISKKSH